MDVNFDNKPEFVVSHPGYNRTYYACFDFNNFDNWQTSYPGFVEPMNEPPYNNLVSGSPRSIKDSVWDDIEVIDSPHTTEFNYKDKTIHIVEYIGCCASVETWAKRVTNIHTSPDGEVKVIREVKSATWGGDDMGGIFTKDEIYEYDENSDSLKLKTVETTKLD